MAATVEPGYETCFCDLIPLHLGNMHWCFGNGNHPSHGWVFAGREVPTAVPVDTEVQCPNCNLIYATTTARNININTSKVALPGQVVKKADVPTI